MSRLVLEGLTKLHGARQCLGPLDLAVDDGEVLSMVGPSGSGKTTLLRLVAGLENPDEGTISLDGTRVDRLPARRRNVAMVSERGGLYGHMTARSNIAFPLTVRAVPSAEIDSRVVSEARAMAIEGLLDRHPGQLSDGEQQMVKAARAVVARPAVLLLDDPLSQVDPAQRTKLRRGVLSMQQRHAVTTLWVTSDHHEAFTVADRVAVLVAGRLRQVDTPDRLRQRPADTTVAAFVGKPAMSLIDLPVRRNPSGGYDLAVGDGGIRMWTELLEPFVSSYVTTGVRPEDVDVGGSQGDDTSRGGRMDASVHSVEHLPTGLMLTLTLADGQRLGALGQGRQPRRGDRLAVTIRGTSVHLFDPITGTAIHHPL
jgi:ABC-type sugar transport system ATPase subunit